MSHDATEGVADVAIVGFGFSGLAVLAHLVAAGRPMRVTVVGDALLGTGLAYGTDDPGHLLNVPAGRMGVWRDAPGDFTDWLEQAGEPDLDGFAPRMVYGRYLRDVRARVLQDAARAGVRITWVTGHATRLRPAAVGWSLSVRFAPDDPTDEEGTIVTRACVLATGHDARSILPEPGPDAYRGPWGLPPATVARAGRRIVLIGSGLTAIDAVLTLRRLGYEDEVLALSRNGLLPRVHRPEMPVLEFDADALAGARRLPQVIGLVRGAIEQGEDWRAAVDAIRPYTATLWQRLSDADRITAIERWGALWSVHRHRMAPSIGERIARELRSGQLQVTAAADLRFESTGEGFVVHYRDRGAADGGPLAVAPRLLIDCTGPELDCGRSGESLLRGLVEDGICTRHHTGLGLICDAGYAVAERLWAIGPLLTGQLWETVAVPELRDQAAAVAAQITGAAPANRVRVPVRRSSRGG